MRRKKNILIGILLSVMFFMGIGYAILSTNFNVTGTTSISSTWNVEITDVVLNGKSTAATSTTPTYTANSVTFSGRFNKPGDYIEYEVTLANNGTIDATLASMTPSAGITLGTATSDGVIYTVSEIEEGYNLLKTTTKTFLIRATLNPDITTLPQNDTNSTITLTLIFNQCDDCIAPVVIPVEDCYTVDSDGLITAYNYECGRNAEVPSTVNDIYIQKIDSKSFLNGTYNAILYYNEGLNPMGLIIIDNANASEIATIMDGTLSNAITGGSISVSSIDGTYTRNGGTVSSIQTLGEGNIVEYYNIDTTADTATQITHNLVSLDISRANSLTEIDDNSFLGKEGANDVCTNAEIYSYNIDEKMVCGLGTLTSVSFPVSTQFSTIGNYAFTKNQLTSIDLFKDGIQTIGVGAFGLNQISTVSLPYTPFYTIISDRLFMYNRLTSINIHSMIVEIGEAAFMGNDLTGSLSLSSSLSTIGGMAFYLNPNLTTINVNRSQAGMTLGSYWNGSATVNYNTP